MDNHEKICLGTAQFGSSYGLTNKNESLSVKEIREILNLANQNGIGFLDTAPTYGNAEIKLGKSELSSWNIITKVSAVNTISRGDNIIKSVEGSLSRLKVDKLYAVLVHNPKLIFESEFSYLLNQLNELKRRGLVRKIGVSVYNSYEVDFLLDNHQIDVVQIPFNIIDGRMLINGTLDKLKSKNIEVHARSIYLQGLLLMDKKDQMSQFGKWNSHWNLLHSFCSENKLSRLEVCLRYVLNNPKIDRVIVGVDNYIQLKQIILAATGSEVIVPYELFSFDDKLCNPSNWNSLQ